MRTEGSDGHSPFLYQSRKTRFLQDDKYPPGGKQLSKHGTVTQLNIEQILKINIYIFSFVKTDLI